MTDKEKIDEVLKHLLDSTRLRDCLMEMAKEIDYRNKYGYFIPVDRSKMTNFQWWLYKQYWPDEDK